METMDKSLSLSEFSNVSAKINLYDNKSTVDIGKLISPCSWWVKNKTKLNFGVCRSVGLSIYVFNVARFLFLFPLKLQQRNPSANRTSSMHCSKSRNGKFWRKHCRNWERPRMKWTLKSQIRRWKILWRFHGVSPRFSPPVTWLAWTCIR